jgi:hypothetical protein
MEQEQPCREQCKYQRQGKCVLERADFLAPVNGATCCEHLFEDEAPLHH